MFYFENQQVDSQFVTTHMGFRTPTINSLLLIFLNMFFVCNRQRRSSCGPLQLTGTFSGFRTQVKFSRLYIAQASLLLIQLWIVQLTLIICPLNWKLVSAIDPKLVLPLPPLPPYPFSNTTGFVGHKQDSLLVKSSLLKCFQGQRLRTTSLGWYIVSFGKTGSTFSL